ncbi:hypothetical protein FDZ71_01005, partial [bacterium]
ASAPFVEVELPFDKAVVPTKSALVIFKVPKGFTPVVFRQEKEYFKESYRVPGDENDLIHILLPLNEGLNKFTWADPATEQRIKYLTIFCIPPSSTKMAMDSAAKPFLFHVPENEKKCSGCHELSPEIESADRKLPIGVLCTSCHRDIISGEVVHRPSGGFTCLYCHDPKYLPSRFTITATEKETCNSCHDDFISKELTSKPFLHGPLAVNSCDVCHTPHSGGKKLLAADTVQELCAHCHYETVNENMAEGLHSKIACSKCHAAHGADDGNFLKTDAQALCAGCHDTVSEGEHAQMHHHPIFAKASADGKTRGMTCISCHTPHGRKDISKKAIFEDENALEQKKFCEKCHYN